MKNRKILDILSVLDKIIGKWDKWKEIIEWLAEQLEIAPCYHATWKRIPGKQRKKTEMKQEGFERRKP
jgi:hypothetical protein